MEHLTIVGAGRVGTSLALDLASLGRFREVRLVGRRAAAPAAVAGSPAVRYCRVQPSAGVSAPPLLPEEGVSVLLFCVPDDALPGVAARWGEALEGSGRAAPRLSLHTSGVHPAGVLGPLRRVGARVAGWHPLLALSAPREGAFRSITFGVEGDDEAVGWATDRSRDLGARALRVRAEWKALYHAAAVFGSNYLVACLAVAEELLRRCLDVDGPEEAGLAAAAGGPETRDVREGPEARGDPAGARAPSASSPAPARTALDALLPLARSALENLARTGPGAGATGPIVRGDLETVRAHLRALDPATSALYRALGAALLRSRGSGRSDEALTALSELLDVEG